MNSIGAPSASPIAPPRRQPRTRDRYTALSCRTVGASHSLELRYLFDVGGAPSLDAAQQRLADQMIDYWSSFVKTGAPVAAGQPDWPQVDAGVMSLQPDGSRMVDDFSRVHQCPFWAGLR